MSIFGFLNRSRYGFTIIELLVTISVIGILASIGIVSYTGYRNSVIETQIKSDLNGVATAMENSKNFNNSYPVAVPNEFIPSDGTELAVWAADATTYCVDATSTQNTSIEYYIDNSTSSVGAQAGNCADRPGMGGATCQDTDKYGEYPNCYDYDALPIGTSISGYWTTAPAGYLLEDGSAVSRDTYSDLFDLIGTTYGSGDGSTTFNVPDSRGRATVAVSAADSEYNVVGEKSGSKTVALTIAQFPSHNHGGGSFSTTTHGHGVAGTTGGGSDQDSYEDEQEQDVAEVSHTHGYSGWTGVPSASSGLNSQGSSSGHNNIQPSAVKVYAIKYAPSTGNYSMLPAGTSLSGYFTTAPAGYLLEDGSAVSRTTYSALFAAITTTYGTGDGSTTFNVPDSRGRIAVNRSVTGAGFDEFDTFNEKYGEKYHTISISEMPSHNHSSSFATNNHQHYFSGTSGTLNYPAGKDSYNDPNEQSGANVGHTHGFSGWTGVTDHGTQYINSEGGGQSHSEIQPVIAKTFVIKHTAASGEVDTLPKGASVQGYWTTAPTGYFLEDGSPKSKVAYADLFAIIGCTYGCTADDFNLPDTRGYTIVNKNPSDAEFDVVGEKYGAKTVALAIATMPSHNHNSSFATAGHTHYFSFWSGGPSAKNRVEETNDQEGANMGHVHPITGNTGGPNATAAVSFQGSDAAHNNIQPSMVQVFAIKY